MYLPFWYLLWKCKILQVKRGRKSFALGWRWLGDELRDWSKWIPGFYFTCKSARRAWIRSGRSSSRLGKVCQTKHGITVFNRSANYLKFVKNPPAFFFEVLEMGFNEICSPPGKFVLFQEKVTFPEADQVAFKEYPFSHLVDNHWQFWWWAF